MEHRATAQDTDYHRRTRDLLDTEYTQGRGKYLARARKMARGSLDPEEVVQDVFLGALANVEALANVQNLGAWLFTAIRNRVADLWRRQRTRARAGEVDVAARTVDSIMDATGLGPLDEFVAAELTDALVDAIDALPQEQRMVIAAQVYDGLTFREVSEATGVPLDTLAGRKRYAIRTLGKALRDWVDSD